MVDKWWCYVHEQINSHRDEWHQYDTLCHEENAGDMRGPGLLRSHRKCITDPVRTHRDLRIRDGVVWETRRAKLELLEVDAVAEGG